MLVDASQALAHWYSRGARRLPWRAPPGAPAPDPYRVWLSEVMLQQTTVAAAIPYFERFTARWPTVDALAAAEDGDLMAAWAGLGYYARARNLLACARMVAGPLRGRFPDTETRLRELPGIGAYTAAAIAAIAFGRRAVVVDGNVERVVSRLFAVDTPLPQARRALHAHADSLTPDDRPGDHAQAMMDLGATICTPRRPACAICPVRSHCAAVRTGAPDRFPVKPARRVRPTRAATAFWLQDGDHVLLERRPPSGLLGGLLGLPTGAWVQGTPALSGAPVEADWTFVPGTIGHTFTHFHLELRLARASGGRSAAEELWWPIDRLDEAGLPTLFRRAADHVLASELTTA